MKSTERLIFHIDVNSAFLSWESARRVSQGLPDLREIPSCVGGNPKKRTGIVVAKSIPAKKYGIQTGEPVAMALRKCPNLVIVPSDFELYDKCSRAFKAICASFAPVMESFSIDEVFLDMDDNCKYALVIQDFHTGEPIDLLRSRRMNVTEPYFTSLPPEERNSVKYLISDMYNPYISYVDKYFPNAVPVVDSFHVLQWVTRSIDNYMRQLLKKYKQRDRERQEQLTTDPMHPVQLPISDEVYILQKYRWLILSNQSNIRYHSDPRMDQPFHVLMNTYDYEDWLFHIDSNLKDFRDLKEQYVLFNSRNGGNPIAARTEIDELIVVYKKSSYEMFRDFAILLEKYKDPIINSFIMVEKVGNEKIYDSRLSNGPIESINRKVKDLKRLGRGFRNFEHFRNRFLYATRSAPVLNGESDYNPVTYFEEDEF